MYVIIQTIKIIYSGYRQNLCTRFPHLLIPLPNMPKEKKNTPKPKGNYQEKVSIKGTFLEAFKVVKKHKEQKKKP